MTQAIYLDHNATTSVRQVALDVWTKESQRVGNAAALHRYGQGVRQRLNESRQQLADLLGCAMNEIIFTSGATEANNMVVKTFTQQGWAMVVSGLEHASIQQAAAAPHIIATGPNGQVDINHLDKLLAEIRMTTQDPILICVVLANSETGIIQPIREVVTIAKRHNAFVHCDGVQAVGKIPVHFRELGVDSMSISGHKFGGPMGCGALIADSKMPLKALLHGGGQEQRLRSGTPNMPAIAAMAAALKEAITFNWDPILQLRDRVETQLGKEGAYIVGQDSPRLPNTSFIAMPGVTFQAQLMAFDLAGIAVSAGSACSSGSAKVSLIGEVLRLPENLRPCTLRISLGYTTQSADIEAFIHVWKEINQRCHAKHVAPKINTTTNTLGVTA